MRRKHSTRCQVIFGRNWIPVSLRQPFSSMFTDTFSESLPTSCVRISWKPWNVNSWIPRQRRPGHDGKVRESTCTGILTSTCVLYTRRPFDVWRGDGFAPALHRIPTTSPHCRRKSDLYWKTWRLRHLHAQKRRSRAWSDLGNWLQRCYLDLFTLMKHIWIGRWPRQTSVALMNWLGGHFFVYINNKFSWLEQYSGCWGFSVQIPLPAFRPGRLIGTRGVLFGNQMSPQSHFWWCEDQPFDHTRTKSTCSKSIISPCRNKSRKPCKTWKNWALQMAWWRPNTLGLLCPSHRLAHVYSFFLRVIVGDANCTVENQAGMPWKQHKR